MTSRRRQECPCYSRGNHRKDWKNVALLIRAEDAPDIITMEEAIDAVEAGFRLPLSRADREHKPEPGVPPLRTARSAWPRCRARAHRCRSRPRAAPHRSTAPGTPRRGPGAGEAPAQAVVAPRTPEALHAACPASAAVRTRLPLQIYTILCDNYLLFRRLSREFSMNSSQFRRDRPEIEPSRSNRPLPRSAGESVPGRAGNAAAAGAGRNG